MKLEIAGDVFGEVVMAERIDHPAFLRDDEIIVRTQVEAVLWVERGAGVLAAGVKGEAEAAEIADPRRRISGVERRVGLGRAGQRDARDAGEGNVAAAAGDEAGNSAGAAAGLSARNCERHTRLARRGGSRGDAAVGQ